MADLFNRTKTRDTTQYGRLETRYNSSVANLLLVVAFSTLNVVLLIANSNTYFLFSAFIPYILADIGMFYTGMYPEEYYYDLVDIEFANKTFLFLTIGIAAVVILLYLLSWIFAKKKKVGWLIFALVLFGIDTVAMFWVTGFSVDSIIDIVFHVWIIISLVNGIVTYFKMKKLPEEVLKVGDNMEFENDEVQSSNSSVLRMADMEVKARILLETDALGYHIVYRRVKRTNELVVNGRVYDEYEALAEFPHTLTAVIDGHRIEVQYDATSHIYILMDGEQLAKKMRLF